MTVEEPQKWETWYQLVREGHVITGNEGTPLHYEKVLYAYGTMTDCKMLRDAKGWRVRLEPYRVKDWSGETDATKRRNEYKTYRADAILKKVRGYNSGAKVTELAPKSDYKDRKSMKINELLSYTQAINALSRAELERLEREVCDTCANKTGDQYGDLCAICCHWYASHYEKRGK